MLQSLPLRGDDAIATDAEERGFGRWLAPDDDVESWPAARRHSVVAPTNPWQGLAQPSVADKLSAALELLCTGQQLSTEESCRAALPKRFVSGEQFVVFDKPTS